MRGSKKHWLKTELVEKLGEGLDIFQFLLDGSLDGIWYLDCTDYDAVFSGDADEFYSDDYWWTLGYDPSAKKYKHYECQQLIHEKDLVAVKDELKKHFADPSHPYDLIVRYKRPDGDWTWVRERGLLVRDANNNANRMLGAHTDVTPIHKAKDEIFLLKEQVTSLHQYLQETKTNIKFRDE